MADSNLRQESPARQQSHTPGPWYASGHLIRAESVGPGFAVATVRHGPDLDPLGEDHFRANAHLIAAAPKMYDMLASIENDAGQVPEWLWERIQSVLAEARGEVPS